MKDFNKMSSWEIQSMSDEEFKAVPPEQKKSCYDCDHLKSVISWWCTNPNAIKARGTRIPGVIKCPFWSSMKKIPEDRKNFIPDKTFKQKLISWLKF